jgi:hypothetical protein
MNLRTPRPQTHVLAARLQIAIVRRLWHDSLVLFNATDGPFVRGVQRRGDQEALYAILHGKFDERPALGVQVLPLEWQCPRMLPWLGQALRSPPNARLESAPCRFVHWHGVEGKRRMNKYEKGIARRTELLKALSAAGPQLEHVRNTTPRAIESLKQAAAEALAAWKQHKTGRLML